MQLFKSHRADILKRGMSPNPVREALHKLEDGLPGRGPRLEEGEINALALEGSEERLHCGILPTVPLATHTPQDATIGK
jgi:hypothetical protein